MPVDELSFVPLLVPLLVPDDVPVPELRLSDVLVDVLVPDVVEPLVPVLDEVEVPEAELKLEDVLVDVEWFVPPLVPFVVDVPVELDVLAPPAEDITLLLLKPNVTFELVPLPPPLVVLLPVLLEAPIVVLEPLEVDVFVEVEVDWLWPMLWLFAFVPPLDELTPSEVVVLVRSIFPTATPLSLRVSLVVTSERSPSDLPAPPYDQLSLMEVPLLVPDPPEAPDDVLVEEALDVLSDVPVLVDSLDDSVVPLFDPDDTLLELLVPLLVLSPEEALVLLPVLKLVPSVVLSPIDSPVELLSLVVNDSPELEPDVVEVLVPDALPVLFDSLVLVLLDVLSDVLDVALVPEDVDEFWLADVPAEVV